ncbi:MAG TPA: DUF6264 family protein [Pseudolysinimonas sp.]|nr:DUF6264 family protein [Pseudolysinimonas sp.]
MSEPSQPAAPQPPVPPVPRYGEYAPEGYVPPRPAPGYETAGGYVPQAYPAPPVGRQRRIWDLVLTVILLVVGLVGAFIGVAYGLIFTNPDLVAQALDQQGYSGFNGDTSAAAGVLIVSHIVLYLVAVGVSIPMLVAKRVTFWVPLVIGVVAAIVFWITVIAAIMSDPAFVSTLS